MFVRSIVWLIVSMMSWFVTSFDFSGIPWKRRIGRRKYCSRLSASISRESILSSRFTILLCSDVTRDFITAFMAVVILLISIGAIFSIMSNTSSDSLVDFPRPLLPFHDDWGVPREVFNSSISSTKHAWMVAFKSIDIVDYVSRLASDRLRNP